MSSNATNAVEAHVAGKCVDNTHITDMAIWRGEARTGLA
jgi:hypothetical protein